SVQSSEAPPSPMWHATLSVSTTGRSMTVSSVNWFAPWRKSSFVLAIGSETARVPGFAFAVDRPLPAALLVQAPAPANVIVRSTGSDSASAAVVGDVPELASLNGHCAIQVT